MHPYQMQRLLRLRHKDEILALKRGSLYHAIGRLMRDGLISVETTSREGKRPERTTYRITPVGQDSLVDALRKIVATPRRESSEFMAAMSFLPHLDPQETFQLLQERGRKLEGEIAQLSAGVMAASAHVQRINLVESEYLLAMLTAELTWVRSLEAEIQGGGLTWDLEAIIRDVQANHNSANTGEK